MQKDYNITRLLLNYLSLIVVPIFLFAVFRTTPSLLRFDFTLLYPWTFFTHSYFHAEPVHLIYNLFAYVLLVSVNVAVFASTGTEREFNRAFLAILAFTPFITSTTSFVFFYVLSGVILPPMNGMSDILSALLGMTFFSLLRLLDIRGTVKRYIYLLIYLVPLAFIILARLDFMYSMLIMITPVIVGLIAGNYRFRQVPPVLFVLLVLIFLSIASFPQVLVDGGILINTMSHLTGILYGLILGLVLEL